MSSTDPLFTDPKQSANEGYILSRRQMQAAPPSDSTETALNVIREKLSRIYAEEPSAKAEEKKAAAAIVRSKHQQYMYELQASGKSLADIQTAWHDYYASLSDVAKHEVWREFYQANGQIQRAPIQPKPIAETPYQPGRSSGPSLSQAFTQSLRDPKPIKATKKLSNLQKQANRTFNEIQQALRDKISANGKLNVKHHLQSLSFGLVIGFITLVITLFSFFNEVIIAPFIQPGRMVGATPIIIDPSSATASNTPEVIIPKINLEIPADYTQTSDNETTIQNALENGIVHYPSTILPGQNGNAAYFGHSSNNIFNPGKYKFAFVLLHELIPGDTFYLTYNGTPYIYKVFERKVVEPSEVDVLNNIAGHPATATLITCDPPGTALHRLVVVGDQISPAISNNSAITIPATATNAATQLPDNGPSLFDRIWHTIFH
jgi:LPXTG-site transpeptidase (sortase) family protein